MNIRRQQSGDNECYPKFEISMKMRPLILKFWDSALTNIMITIDKFQEILSQQQNCGKLKNKEDICSNNDMNCSSALFELSFCCDFISVRYPIDMGWMSNEQMEQLFMRSNRFVSNILSDEAEIEIGFDDLNLSTLNGNVSNSNERKNTKSGDIDISQFCKRQVVITCQKTILSIRNPIHGQGTPNIVQILDILSLESEVMIDPDAFIKFEFTQTVDIEDPKVQKKWAHKCFPTTSPLSSVKASQQTESYHEKNQTSSFPAKNRKLRGSGPQESMLSDATKARKNIFFHVPTTTLNISLDEKNVFIVILSRCLERIKKSGSSTEIGHKSKGLPENVRSKGEELIGISLRCDQIRISLCQRSNQEKETTKNESFSYMFIFDRMLTHILTISSRVKNVRFLTRDITLYEGKFFSRVLVLY